MDSLASRQLRVLPWEGRDALPSFDGARLAYRDEGEGLPVLALSGLTIAEYFRDEEGRDVLFFVDNIYRFTLAGTVSDDGKPLPANLTMQAVFGPGGKEQRFDFTFEDFSTDSAPAALDVATRLMMDIPDSAPDIVKMLGERRNELKDVLDRGGLSEVWVPALQGKELALALEFHARESLCRTFIFPFESTNVDSSYKIT